MSQFPLTHTTVEGIVLNQIHILLLARQTISRVLSYLSLLISKGIESKLTEAGTHWIPFRVHAPLALKNLLLMDL